MLDVEYDDSGREESERELSVKLKESLKTLSGFDIPDHSGSR